MYRKLLLSIFFVSLFFLLVGCEWKRVTTTPEIGLPNPASVHCEEQGGKLEIRTDSDGGQFGMCVFPDGSECDEWTYFRGECAPAGSAATSTGEELPNPASVYCEEQGGKLEIRTDASGGQVGICVFSDNSECDEWAYFRGECAPGASKPTATP